MQKSVRFILKEEQIRNLRAHYADDSFAQRILSTEKKTLFTVPVDDYVDFWDWLDDQSVFTVDEDYEPTEETYLFEDMIDFMAAQERAPETFNPIYNEIEKA